MTANPNIALLVLSISWFVIYWILGGVAFSLIAAARAMHMKKARFSCLFTLGAAATAFCAAYTGMLISRPHGLRCPNELIIRGALHGAERVGIQSVFMCDFRAIVLAGGMFFVLLLALGTIALVLSRTEKQR